MGREKQVLTFTPIFTVVAFKMWAYGPQNIRFADFGINFGPEGYIPFSDFYKTWHGEQVPGPHRHANFQHCGFKNVGLRPTKSPKIAIFGINLPIRKHPRGP